MNSENKVLVAFITAACVLVPTGIAVGTGMNGWLWALITLALLTIPYLVARKLIDQNNQRRMQRELDTVTEHPAPVEQPAPLPYQQEDVTEVALPSSVADYDFLFSATVWWRPVPNPPGIPHANPGGLAIDSVLSRARDITAQGTPERRTVVQHKLNAVLGTVLRDETGRVESMANNVALTLSEADLRRLRKLSDVRKDEEVWEHERNHERNKRTYLSDDVLKNPGSALVWWLANNETQVEQAVKLIGPLAKLSAAATGTDVPDLYLRLASEQYAADAASGSGAGFGSGAGSGSSTGSASGNGYHAFPDGAFSDFTVHFPEAEHRNTTDLLADLMTALDLDPDSDRGALLANRFAKLVDTAGKPEEAAEIRRRFDHPSPATPDTDRDSGPDSTVDPDGTDPAGDTVSAGGGGSHAGNGAQQDEAENGHVVRPHGDPVETPFQPTGRDLNGHHVD